MEGSQKTVVDKLEDEVDRLVTDEDEWDVGHNRFRLLK